MMIFVKRVVRSSELRVPSLSVFFRRVVFCCESSGHFSKVPSDPSPPWTKLFSTKSNDYNNDNRDLQKIDLVESPLSSLSKQDLTLAVQAATVEDAPIPSNMSLNIDQIPGTSKGGSRKLAIVFTCKVCDTRSVKKFTERAYNHGVVLVRCPKCNNLHLIADRLGYFSDGEGGKGWDIEMFMKSVGNEDNIKVVTEGQEVLEVLLKDGIGGQSQNSGNRGGGGKGN
eukprot:CAMPEP_0176487532 /NCGR_PEP_ID=MMETSP0200_2-20121128/6192_1 /TAXON_ID=947934 /ORGANISM="Chaetoceros sp., Strain GSL56" /LENGTH=225 /DNA_ID=CAMNT_0017884387 /DNA_START=107 /DNA_END=784 /DNA_ORIENTATION=-